MIRTSLGDIGAVVQGGGSVISAERSILLSIIQETILSGKSATFYVTKCQFDEIMSWFWTAEHRERFEIEEVSVEEQQRIESELGIERAGFVYSIRVKCENRGCMYGAFEFIQQGIREHGREIVETALALANAFVVTVNPTTVAVCQNCNERLIGPRGHHYSMSRYGCCRPLQ